MINLWCLCAQFLSRYPFEYVSIQSDTKETWKTTSLRIWPYLPIICAPTVRCNRRDSLIPNEGRDPGGGGGGVPFVLHHCLLTHQRGSRLHLNVLPSRPLPKHLTIFFSSWRWQTHSFRFIYERTKLHHMRTTTPYSKHQSLSARRWELQSTLLTI